MRQLKIQKSITNRSSEALDKYLVEIGRAPLISIDEEIELAQKIRKGGPDGERVATGIYNVYAAQGAQPDITGTPKATVMVIR